MTRNKLLIRVATASLLSAAAGGGAALASNAAPRQEDERAEVAAVNGAHISLSQAVALAEQQGSGKAMEASFDDETGSRWEVEIATGDHVTAYAVDMQSGAISTMAEDADEADEGVED